MTKTRFRIKPTEPTMGKIIVDVSVSNLVERDCAVRFDALVDTGATFLTRPTKWQSKLRDLELMENVELELASGDVVEGEIRGRVSSTGR